MTKMNFDGWVATDVCGSQFFTEMPELEDDELWYGLGVPVTLDDELAMRSTKMPVMVCMTLETVD